jgi:hypothetical protein
MSGQAIDFSKYEQQAPAQPQSIDFSKYEQKGAPGLDLSNPSMIPNARIRNMTVDPTKDVHSAGQALYEGAKTGLMLGSIPASAALTPAEAVLGTGGGIVGGAAGKQIAKSAGAGEFGQEVGGDVGGAVGAGLTAGFGNWAAGKARALYSALPDAVQKEVLGVVSPRLRHAISFWDALTSSEGAAAAPNFNGELDATGENKPFAGGLDEWIARRQKELDATGENKPFAGGMDSAPAPRAAAAATQPPAAQPVVSQSAPVAPQASPIPPRYQPPAPAARPAPASSVATPAPAAAPSATAGYANDNADSLMARLRFHAAQVEHQPAAAKNIDEDLSQQVIDSLRVLAKQGNKKAQASLAQYEQTIQ